MEGFNIRTVLPAIRVNKKVLKRKEKRAKKHSEEEEKEFVRIHGRKSLQHAKKDHKKTHLAGDKVKERRPKTIIANAETGKETFLKHKAKQLLKEKKAKERKLKKKEARKDASKASTKVKQSQKLNRSSTLSLSSSIPVEDDKDLLLRTIRGDTTCDNNLFSSESIYPDFGDGNTKSSNLVSEDEVLEKANEYFKNLRKKEREINRAASLHLKKMKEVNRQGGDKDGFRYVIPKNTKDLVRQMMEKEGIRSVSLVDSSPLSLFSSMNNIPDEDDKPQRKTRRRGGTYSDFYQFQVSKKWTQNAERFLFRDRVDKSLFESKKHQRSIKNL